VSSAQVPNDLIAFLKEGQKFLVVGHKEPDGDCVGSQLAFTSFLTRLGKTAIPCSAGPFKRPEVQPYAHRFTAAPSDLDRQGARVIILDCSNSSRVGYLEPLIEGLPTAIIDHHMAEHEEEAIHFVDPRAPSVTYLSLLVMGAMGVQPTPEEAELLLFGLCTDTGYFRHIEAGRPQTFEAAAILCSAGANPKAIFQAMYGGKSFGSRVLMGRILSRAEELFDGRLLLSYETEEDTAAFGLEGRDSDMLYQLLQSVRGVEAIVLIRQESPGHCTLGLRSRSDVDVAAIAAQFGGGGHRQASGAYTEGTIEGLKPRVIEAFSSAFCN